jgi:nitrogen regulatory protein P-II 1
MEKPTNESSSRTFEVTAMLKPHLVDPVSKAMIEAGIVGMTRCEVMGYGRQRGHHEIYKESEYKTDFLPKVQITILLPESSLQTAMDILAKTVQEQPSGGRFGDGIAYVKEVFQATRLRTGEALFQITSKKSA